MAARQAPQLRMFRNDFAPRGASLAIRLTGTTSNRDAIGARVIVETDRLRGRRSCRPARASSRSTRRNCCSASGQPAESDADGRVAVGPAGRSFTDVAAERRVSARRGRHARRERRSRPSRSTWGVRRPRHRASPSVPAQTRPGFTSRSRRRTSRCPDLTGHDALARGSARATRASSCSGRATAPGRRAQRSTRSREAATRWRQAGSRPARHRARCRPRDRRRSARVAPPGCPSIAREPGGGLSYAILNRHLFMNRQDLRLPTALLLDAAGTRRPAYRDGWMWRWSCGTRRAIDAPPAERLRAPCPSPARSIRPPPLRNYLPYGRELLDQGLDAAAVVAFERAAQASPSASTLYRLGTLLTKSGEMARARAAYRTRARADSRTWPRPTTISARCSRRTAISRRPSRGSARRSRRPRLSGRAQQPRLRAAASAARRGSARALRKGARAAARFPGGAQQPGTALRPRGRPRCAPNATSAMRSRGAPTTAKPPTTWRSCSSRGDRRPRRRPAARGVPAKDAAVRGRPTSRSPRSTSAPAVRARASRVLERLLQRNPHASRCARSCSSS